MPGLESSVLTRRTLSVVVVTDDNPLDVAVTVVRSSLGHTTNLASELVGDLVGLTILRVDGTNQAVLCKRVSYEILNPQKIVSSREMFSRCPRYFNHGPPAEM